METLLVYNNNDDLIDVQYAERLWANAAMANIVEQYGSTVDIVMVQEIED